MEQQEEYLKYIRKQYRMTKLLVLLSAGVFLVLLFSALVLVPRASHTLQQADEVLTDLAQVTEELEQADLPGLVDHMDTLILESGEGVQEALEKVNSMDIDTLNDAIRDLQAIVEPLARFFGR